ncbi:MAG: PAS domain S-box protein [Candidatus Riflebacteria bacterium]|nr:PAS domain S-box protein [Candidatus Riflebacteria bacterium]
MTDRDRSAIDLEDMDRIRREAIEFAGIGLYRYGFDGTVLFMDRGAMRILDLDGLFEGPSQVVGRNIETLLVYTGYRGRLLDEIRKQGRLRDFEYPFRTLTGINKWVLHDSYLTRDARTGQEVVQAIIRDITERKLAQVRIQKLNRTLRVVSRINELIVRESDPDRLLGESCRIIVQDGEFPFAWIGLLEPGTNRFSRSAHAGVASGDAGGILATLGMPPVRLEIVDEVHRTGQPVVCLEDPKMAASALCAPWMAAAHRAGFSAAAALPLMIRNTVGGVLCLLARETDDLGEKTVSLMGELTRDIGYAIQSLDEVEHRRRAEAALTLERERLAVTLRSIGDGVIATDAEGRVVLVNDAAERLTGHAESESLGKPLEEIFSTVNERTGQPCRNPIRKVLEATPSRRVVALANHTVLIARDGTRKSIADTATAICTGDGRVIGVVLVFQDITDKQRSKKALELNQTRLEALLELNQMGQASLKQITSFALERALQITGSTLGYLAFVNEDETALTLHSWSRSAMKECALPEMLVTQPVGVTGLLGEVVRRKGPVIVNDYAAPDPVKHGCPEGHVAIDRFLTVPVLDGDRVVIAIGVANKVDPYDNTDAQQLILLASGMWRLVQRQRIETALRESEERFRKLSEASFEGIVIHEKGLILEANESFAAMFGRERAEMIGQPLWEFMASDSQSPVRSRASRKSEEPFEAVGQRKDGARFDVELVGRPFPFQGRMVRVMAVRDITLRKDIETQLRQAQKMEGIGRLAGGIAHDFNNLTGVIMGYAALALEDRTLPPGVTDSIRQILKATERAASLTQHLLAYSRKSVLHVQRLNVNRVISNLKKMLRRILREDIVLKERLQQGLPDVSADRNALEQVLVNLVVNARDAMPHGGTLTIATSVVQVDEEQRRQHQDVRRGSHIRIDVVDTGVGMDDQTRSRIFEPFFTTKEVGEGTGLGLSMVYGIVKQHGGFIEVESKVGEGTRLSIHLPAHKLATRQRRRSPGPRQLLEGGENVLLVEDESMLRRLVKETLESHGYRVVSASTAANALAAFARSRSRIDLVLTDIVLPGGKTGWELARELCKRQPDLTVIYTSAYSKDLLPPDDAAPVTVPNFIQKPCHLRDLVATIRRTLDARKDRPERPGRSKG